MREIIEIIDKLKELSGNEQLDYLRLYKDNVILREVLEYTYNTDKKYNINEAKLDKALKSIITTSDIKESDYTVIDVNIWNDYKKCLDELCSKKGVKEADIESLCRAFFIHREEKSKSLLRGILLKDLRLGLNVKSISKIFPNLFNTLQVQLANKFTGKVFENPYYSRKFDGKRLYIMDCKPYSRTNKECSIKPIQHLIDELSKIKGINDIVLDGENLYFDENGKEDFQKGISLTSKDERSPECENICYVIFDAIPKDNFVNKFSFVDFKHEYNWLLQNFADFNKETPCYSLIGTKLNNVYIARQDNDVKKLSELRDENNWEGLMVRDGDMPYEYKRTNSLLKLKKMQDGEFEIFDFIIGTKKYENTLGAIRIKLETGETVDVGSGFSDDDRNYIWNNKDNILNSGYKLKVQYFEQTKDKNGKNSLRFPVFKAFRKDDIETMRL